MVLLFAVALTANACAQIINEATMRQYINNTITTNNNKQITGALHRALMQRLVTFITGGAAGVSADSLAAANYIPFFKTTGVLDKSNLFLSSGKIGLGTTTPNYPLHVIGAASASAYRIGATVFADTTSTDVRIYRKNGKVGIKLGASNSTTYYENYNHIFRLQDSGEELGRLGYGIGFQIRSYGNVTNIQGNFITTTDTLGSFIPLSFWSREFAFATDPTNNFPTTRMVIKTNGLVGIGRTSPVYGLDVARSFRADSSAYLATIAANRVGIGNTSASYKLDVTGDIRSTLGANFATSSGSVGIGNTSPVYKLDVTGDLRGTTNAYFATSSGNVGIGVASAAHKLVVKTGTNQNFQFRPYAFGSAGVLLSASNDADTAPVPFEFNGLFYAFMNGNLGVNTTAPTSKLHVVGLPEYADNAAAVTAGLTIGAFYRTGDLLKVVH